MNKQYVIAGPIAIVTETESGQGTITSNLRAEVTPNEADILEAFLLALACEGVSFDERYARALTTTMDALDNQRS